MPRHSPTLSDHSRLHYHYFTATGPEHTHPGGTRAPRRRAPPSKTDCLGAHKQMDYLLVAQSWKSVTADSRFTSRRDQNQYGHGQRPRKCLHRNKGSGNAPSTAVVVPMIFGSAVEGRLEI